MHSRLRASGPDVPLTEENVQLATNELIQAARANGLDQVGELRLPDLALLAHLQHHGAATPLLDVTVDPFVALWMVAHASAEDPSAEDKYGGAIFAIARPANSDRWLHPLDSRAYFDEDRPDIATALAAGVHWYRPPDISERLRIQRGSLLVGPVQNTGQVTFPLHWEPDEEGVGWLTSRIESLGRPGLPATAATEVVRFRVAAGLKAELRRWLDDRAGLTQNVIYPTPWNRPFLEEFCRAYGRSRPLDQ